MTLRALCWPGMPAPSALAEAARRLGVEVAAETVASNEALEERMAREPWDVVFPSDYLVERLAARGALLALDAPGEVLGRIAPWARDAPHDPGCAVSLPFAFGTTGYLCDERLGAGGSWLDLLRPPPGVAVGMLAEAREVVGAALIAAGRSPNDTGPAALDAAAALLRAQRPSVARFDSDDFTGPVVRGEVAAHQAWSGPAAAAVRARPDLRYVVPREGAGLWITAGAVPAAAPDPDGARALLLALTDPASAARTTAEHGHATPNAAARALLPAAIRDDPALFPGDDVLARCHTFHDLGAAEAAIVAVYDAVRCDAAAPGSRSASVS